MALLRCPHCSHPLGMTDCEVYGRFITTHGEDGPVEAECDGCGRDFFVQEHVTRTWTIGVDAEAAKDLLAPEYDGVGA